MKLGEYLKKYRSEHGMSMQEMADVCGQRQLCADYPDQYDCEETSA